MVRRGTHKQVRRRRSILWNRKTASRGQTLVEFAIVFPLFWTVLMGLIEFSFGFQSVLSVGFAARNAAVIAAEAGNASTADCSILRSIESDVSAPSSAQRITTVDIYWTDANGAIQAGSTTTYTRDTSQAMSCPINGVAATLPYAGPSPNGYPYTSRCSVRSGCGGSHTGVDTVGVKITYSYAYHTPYGVVLGGPGWTVQRSSEMRMEPYQ